MITASELGRLAARVKMAADPTSNKIPPYVMGPSLPYVPPAPKAPKPTPAPTVMSQANRDLYNGAEAQIGSPAYAEHIRTYADQTRTPKSESTFQPPLSPASSWQREAGRLAHGLGPAVALTYGGTLEPNLLGLDNVRLPARMQQNLTGKMTSKALGLGTNMLAFPAAHPATGAAIDAATEIAMPRTTQQMQHDYENRTIPALRGVFPQTDPEFNKRYPGGKMTLLQALGEVPNQLRKQFWSSVDLASSPIGHLANTAAVRNLTPDAIQKEKIQQTLEAQTRGAAPISKMNPANPEDRNAFLYEGVEGFKPPKVTRTWHDYFMREDPTITDQSTPAAQTQMTARKITQGVLLSNDPAKIQAHAQSLLDKNPEQFKQLHPEQQKALNAAYVDAEVQRTPEYARAQAQGASQQQLDTIRAQYFNSELESQLRPADLKKTEPRLLPPADLNDQTNRYGLYKAMIAAKVIPNTDANFNQFASENPQQFKKELSKLIAADKLDISPTSPLMLQLKHRPDIIRALTAASLDFAGQ